MDLGIKAAGSKSCYFTDFVANRALAGRHDFDPATVMKTEGLIKAAGPKSCYFTCFAAFVDFWVWPGAWVGKVRFLWFQKSSFCMWKQWLGEACLDCLGQRGL